jgi:hypothetical protein
VRVPNQCALKQAVVLWRWRNHPLRPISLVLHVAWSPSAVRTCVETAVSKCRAFEKLADPYNGVIAISYRQVACDHQPVNEAPLPPGGASAGESPPEGTGVHEGFAL